MQRRAPLALTTALLSTALSSPVLVGTSSTANAAPITCTNVAGTVTGTPGIKSVTSIVQPPGGGATVSYCRVSILYGNSADQNINIIVGLPLNSVDGGTGGVQGVFANDFENSISCLIPTRLQSSMNPTLYVPSGERLLDGRPAGVSARPRARR